MNTLDKDVENELLWTNFGKMIKISVTVPFTCIANIMYDEAEN